MGILKLLKKTMWIAGSILLVLLLLVGSGGLIAKHYLNKINRVDESTLSTVAPKDEGLRGGPAHCAGSQLADCFGPEAVEWEEIEQIEDDALVNLMLVGQDRREGRGANAPTP